MRIVAAIAFAGLLAGISPAFAQEAAETDVAAFQRLRAEAVAAAGTDDLATAAADWSKAWRGTRRAGAGWSPWSGGGRSSRY